MANTPLSGLTQDTSPPGSGLVLFLDPTDTSMAPTGTDKTATITNILSSQDVVTLGGDLGGTPGSPTVAKLQGTSLSAPSGGSTHYLNATGAWSVPAGGGSGGSSILDWISVSTYGADPTGKTDSTTAFTDAITALPSAGGIVYVPAGTYLISGTLTFKQGQGMIGDGHVTSILTYTGAGPCVKVALSGTFDGSAEAGWFQGWQVSAYGAPSTAIGMQISDLQGVKADDLAFYGCGTAGVYFTTAGSGWAEEGYLTKVSCIQCGTAGNDATGAVVYSGTSFDYGTYEFTVVSNPGAHGIVLQNGAQLEGCRLAVRGNFYASTGNTAGVVAVDPGNTAGTSYAVNCDLAISCETAGSGTGHALLIMGSSNATSQFSGTGVFQLFAATVPPSPIQNPNFMPVAISGIVNTTDSYGNAYMSPGDCMVISGGECRVWAGALGSGLGGTVYSEFASKWVFQLASGSANSVAVTGLGALGKTIDLIIQQPSSGAAGTIGTWPANVKWAGGTAPVLSTASNAGDWIRLEYLPPTQVGASPGYLLGYLVASGFAL